MPAPIEFTGLQFPFAIDSALAKVAEETDYDEHVRQLMMQVLLTAPGERINRPDFGCGVKRLVFAGGGEAAAALAQTTVYQALTRWLGTAIVVHEVSVRSSDSTLAIRVGYVIKARGERRYLNLEVRP